jgi:hypothetical protein
MRISQRLTVATCAVAFALTAWLASPTASIAQSEERTKWSIEDLSWFAGHWEGTLFGSKSEEAWMAPEAGTMIGAFRLKTEDPVSHAIKTTVIEFFIIEETDTGIIYRFKHFNPDYTAWEKDRPLIFDLVELDGSRAVFESNVQNSPKRMTYSLDDAGQLRVLVEGEENGKTDAFEAVYSRVE